MGSKSRGIAQSLVCKEQRLELSRVAVDCGTTLILLKGAWAEPVLYGGRGQRPLGDIDVLVAAEHFADFTTALRRQGYVPHRTHGREASLAAAKGRLHHPPPGRLPVDVHRALVEPPWFEWPAAAAIARARPWASGDGDIWSLCADDQVLLVVAHYASHGLALDGRNLEDLRRLIAIAPIDWESVTARARRAGLDLALRWVLVRLGRNGVLVPSPAPSFSADLRLRLAERIGRSRHLAPTRRLAAALTLLSTRRAALPRFLGRWARLRLRDLETPSS